MTMIETRPLADGGYRPGARPLRKSKILHHLANRIVDLFCLYAIGSWNCLSFPISAVAASIKAENNRLFFGGLKSRLPLQILAADVELMRRKSAGHGDERGNYSRNNSLNCHNQGPIYFCR